MLAEASDPLTDEPDPQRATSQHASTVSALSIDAGGDA